jgi:hypothetical protein
MIDGLTSYWFPEPGKVASSACHDPNPATDLDESEVPRKRKRVTAQFTLGTSSPFPSLELQIHIQSRACITFDRKDLRPEHVGPVPPTLPALGLSEKKWWQLECKFLPGCLKWS